MLVEVLVGIVLMGIVTTVVLDGVIGGFRAQRGLQARGDALTQVRTSAQRVLRQIREADPVLSATRTDLVIKHTDATGGTQCLWWHLDVAGSQLTQSSASTTNCTGWGTAVPVITGIDPAVAPFSYGPRSQWTAPTGSTVSSSTCAISGSAPVTYEQQCIGTVTLSLTRTVTGHTPVVVNATANVRNPG